METITLYGESDTFTLNGRTLTEFQKGDTITFVWPNPATTRIDTHNGVNIIERVDRGVCDVVLNIARGTTDDRWLNNQKRTSPPVVLEYEYKRVFTIDGVEAVESGSGQGGSFTTQPGVTNNNSDGNVNMAYGMQFRKSSREL